MARKLILITGIPGTGKTTFGEFLSRTQGYLHIDMEEQHRINQLLKNHDDFVVKNFPENSNIVMTGGFSPDKETIGVIYKLREFGFKIFWFDGDRKIAREMAIKRTGFDEQALDNQLKSIDAWSLQKKLKAQSVSVFNKQGAFREQTDIAQEIGL